jgi:hypothetical protein
VQARERILRERYFSSGRGGLEAGPESIGDEALVEFEVIGEGPGSGLPIEIKVFHMDRFRDGKFDRVRAFFSREEALAGGGHQGQPIAMRQALERR